MGVMERGPLGLVISILSVLIFLSSSFYWLYLYYSSDLPPNANGIIIAVVTDCIHGAFLVLCGVFGFFTACDIGQPALLVVHIVLCALIVVGIVTEIALYFTLLEGRCDLSILTLLLCAGFGNSNTLQTAEIAVAGLAVPLVLTLTSLILSIILCAKGSDSSEFFFDE